jgi:hypothetical protein
MTPEDRAKTAYARMTGPGWDEAEVGFIAEEIRAAQQEAFTAGFNACQEEVDLKIRRHWNAIVEKERLCPGSLLEKLVAELLNSIRSLPTPEREE